MDEIKQQLSQVNDSNAKLKAAVEGLSRQLTVTKDQTKELHKQGFRTRVLTWFCVGLMVVTLGVVGLGVYAQHQSCEKVNKTRESSRLLWNFIVDISEASPGNAKNKKPLENIRTYVNQSYQPLKCGFFAGNGKPAPEPPPILKQIKDGEIS